MADPDDLALSVNESRRQALGSFLWQDRERILTMARRMREEGGVLECRILGGSMGTAVPGGCRIRIRVAHGEQYPEGRVVAFLVGTTVMVHRVRYRCRSARARGHLIARGDVMLLPDSPVRERDLLGPVIEVEDGGHWRDPGVPARRRWPARLVAGALLVTLAAITEASVPLARRLAAAAIAVRDRVVRVVG